MTTYYVAASGSNSDTGLIGHPWQTSSKVEGIANTAGGFVAGDQILFNRGDTFGDLTIYAGFLNGSVGSPITFGAYGTGALPIFSAGGGSWTVSIRDCTYLTFQDLQLTGAADYAFRITVNAGSVTHINITRCRAYSNVRHGFYGEGSSPNFLDDITYRDCLSELNGDTGYHFFGNTTAATGVHYYNCKSTYNGQTYDSHGFSSYNCVNMNWHECEGSYTNINPGTGLPNSGHTGGLGGEGIGLCFDDFTSSSRADHCYFHHNANNGLTSSHQGTNNTTSACLIVNNLGSGIIVNGNPGTATNTVITNSTIANNGTYGIDAASGPNAGLTIKNCIIANNGTWGISYGATSVTSSVVDTNIIYGNTSGATQNVSGATGTITTNPMFTTPGSVYTLQSGSPAIDAGLNLGSTYRYLVSPASIWPSSVLFVDQMA